MDFKGEAVGVILTVTRVFWRKIFKPSDCKVCQARRKTRSKEASSLHCRRLCQRVCAYVHEHMCAHVHVHMSMCACVNERVHA